MLTHRQRCWAERSHMRGHVWTVPACLHMDGCRGHAGGLLAGAVLAWALGPALTVGPGWRLRDEPPLPWLAFKHEREWHLVPPAVRTHGQPVKGSAVAHACMHARMALMHACMAYHRVPCLPGLCASGLREGPAG